MRQAPLAGLFVVTLALVGCNRASDPKQTAARASGGVAVLDLDEVARRLGRDSAIVDALQERENALNEQLAQVQQSFASQLEEKQQAYGETPTEEQSRELAGMQQQIRVKLQEVKQQAQVNMNQHKVAVVNRFRDEVKPVASQVAAARGLSIIVPKNDALLFAYEDAVNITDAVAEKLLAQHGGAAAPSEGAASSGAGHAPEEPAPLLTRQPASALRR